MPDRSLYSSVFSGRYPRRVTRELFSDNTKFGGWRRVWFSVARGQKTLGVEQVTAEALEQMANQLDNIDYELAAQLEKDFRHDVVAHAHTYGAVCPAAAPIIHLGCTSCDVTDNAELTQMKSGINLQVQHTASLIKCMSEAARPYAALPMLGHTHWQPAQPVTLGHRIVMWLQDIVEHLQKLERLESELKLRGIKGATGTQDAMLKVFKGDIHKLYALECMLAEDCGFAPINVWPITGQTYTRMVDSEILLALACLAASIHKMCLDLRFLQQLKEVEEPFEEKQKPSSAMPYKRNPMRSERVCSLARHIIALAMEALMTQANQGLERTLDDSAGRRIYIPEVFLATDAILLICQNIFSSLVVYPKMMEKHLNEELPFLASEEVIVAMVEAGANRQEVHEKVRLHSQQAGWLIKSEGQHNELIPMLEADTFFAPVHDRLRKLLDPARFIGRAPEQVGDYLDDEVAAVLERYPAAGEEKAALNV